ncbi:CRISPR-associated endonuclease Cas3'' [Tahibacter amnicola]|uniref:CRISPR-associated endonuclease Cas3 n=1 Tax=Tahibacter amnicola TaxID=2976241 RepID=A0ABY6BBX2_9GAMM|nr:CRISPR-associated endonuclease Cas3'' [Tahibacter amnicola]UXI67307.1 CRISPR-associated endonuclease Cas3'' [Tahibacter amnicola]
MVFHAHSTEKANRSDWQLLREHLVAVGEGAAANAAWFNAQVLARVAGMLHDLGKYTERFQRRLAGDPYAVDHATWGARIVRERYSGRQNGLATLLAYAIAGHHAGLANGDGGEKRSSLRERMSDDYRQTLPPLLSAWESEIALPDAICLPDGFKPCSKRGAFQLALLVRMLFSCLVDADYLDTDNFYRRVEGAPPRLQNMSPGLALLRDTLSEHLARLPTVGGVNPIRAEVLAHVRSKATETPGLFSLTVPTGGGKTLASLAFALDHAVRHGLRRIIYVIPFTSIVEQTAAVFRGVFGDSDDVVLEHHSAFVDDPSTAFASKDKRRLAMENWDSPIVVTTAVQFFESLFADRPSRCRKLHNIAGSVVVLDEAQTLPPKLLRPCVALIDELALNYGTSVVICTATQPSLRKDQGFPDGLENVRELAPEPRSLYQRLRRVTVRHVGVLEDETLVGNLRSRNQVLCIVNNRRHARHLLESMEDLEGTYHLTTLMYARHRRQVLEEVRARLAENLPCRLVSTSLIEAGVDISFPSVWRAEAGLDSVAQAAGRCNREGLALPEASEVLVFRTANPHWAPPPELKRFAEAFRATERRHSNDLLALAAVDDYFREIYHLLGSDRLDNENLLGLLKGAGPENLPLETLAARFRIVETAMLPIIVPFVPGTGNREPYISNALKTLEYAATAGRWVQPYLVQVPRQAYDALRCASAIAPVAPERYGEQFVELVNPRLYDARFGLRWDNPQFLDAEQLVR